MPAHAADRWLEEALFLDLLALGHRARLRAFGTSMLPWIWPGQTLLIEPPPFVAPPLGVGDLVLARAGGCLRLHRVVALGPGRSPVLKGDASLRFDPPVESGHLYGRVVEVGGTPGAWRPLSGVVRAAARVTAACSRRVGGLASWLGMGHKGSPGEAPWMEEPDES